MVMEEFEVRLETSINLLSRLKFEIWLGRPFIVASFHVLLHRVVVFAGLQLRYFGGGDGLTRTRLSSIIYR